MATLIRRRPLCEARDLPGELPPLLARVYAARQVRCAAELDRGLGALLAPERLRGMDRAVALLAEALERGRRILVVADFDADGATSCALALRGLRALGAAAVDFVVPNRFEYGYGLTPEIVAVAAARAPEVLITVDNGISSVAGVSAARERGMRVLVTDHHLPGSELPPADAIVNPNQPGDDFPSKNLAGVGVMFYVLMALRAHLRGMGWFRRRGIPEPNLARFLDLVAFGTVADVVPLDHNNRILVEQGLRRIRAGQCVAGIRALMEVAGRDAARACAGDIGFALGPRINAAGRLEDMSLGIECLLADEPGAARTMAGELDRLNRERQAIQADMQAQAEAALERLALDGATLPFGLCLYDESWHEGVIGILAGRIRERVHRPVIAFAPARDGQVKGSARSVPGLHIRDALDAVAAAQPGLLHKFGGHAMAAGLSLELHRLEAFRTAFDREVRRHLGEDDLRGVFWSDGELAVADLSLDLAETLRQAGPWGQGFPEPLFDGVFRVVAQRVLGDRHLKLRLCPEAGEAPVEAIAFHQAGARALSAPGERVRVAFRLDVNEWRGRRSAQLRVEHIEPPAG